MEALKAEVIEEITSIATQKIDILHDYWRRLYEPLVHERNLKYLVEYVDTFFSAIIDDTEERERKIKGKIEVDLNREKLELTHIMKENVHDVPDDVPLHTLQMNIDESLKNLREKLSHRCNDIESLLRERDLLCNELDEAPRPLMIDPLPSREEIYEFKLYLDSLKREKLHRSDEIQEIRAKIQNLISKLEITSLDKNDEDLLKPAEIQPSRRSIKKLERLLNFLNDKLDELRDQIHDLHSRLVEVWKFLDFPESHRRKFARLTDVTQTNFDKLHAEYLRCERIKKDNMKIYIEKIRIEIEEYWGKCSKSEEERSQFSSFTSKTFTEQLLALHEKELSDLKKFYEDNKPIFELLKERRDLWSQMEKLLTKESEFDPKRYNNRGGQLLREEKERKMIASKLPELEKKIFALVEKFEAENARPFTIKGVKVQDIIEKDYENIKETKKDVKRWLGISCVSKAAGGKGTSFKIYSDES